MITIIYSTHKDENYNSNFESHLKKTSGLDNIQIIKFINHNEFSLANIYNRGISQSKFDIVVCIHNDISLSKNWGKKLIQDFNQNPEFSIIGKAGSCYFPESGIYWEHMDRTMVGQVYHHPKNQKKILSSYSAKIDGLVPVVTIDGLFISFNKTKINHKFDESIGKFHFYDHSFCVPNYLDGIKIGVTNSFEITHESVGRPNDEFFSSKEKFIEKYGKFLPINEMPKNIFNIKQITKHYNKKNKVAVVIPSKGKLDLLFGCLNSLIEHSNKDNYEVFLADTGSSEYEKKLIGEFINSNKDNIIINLIEYDYYNFAKINNDVVKNHISNKFNFLLFLNNDVKILTNVIDSMLNIFNKNNKIGTVGGRLHYEDNTIQHDGIFVKLIKDNNIVVSHIGLRSYYKFSTTLKKVIGNTGALLMIRKNVFDKVGMFNESYINCFEDVELNLQCILHGYENYLDPNSVAYHYESVSRNENPDNLENLKIDYISRLRPFIITHINKLQPYFVT
jgi:GT2 family glycosyltransferase